MGSFSQAAEFERLVTGYYSVQTTADALQQGERNIAAIGRRLHNQGVLA